MKDTAFKTFVVQKYGHDLNMMPPERECFILITLLHYKGLSKVCCSEYDDSFFNANIILANNLQSVSFSFVLSLMLYRYCLVVMGPIL